MFIGEPGGSNRSRVFNTSRVSNRSQGLLLEEIRYTIFDTHPRHIDFLFLVFIFSASYIQSPDN